MIVRPLIAGLALACLAQTLSKAAPLPETPMTAAPEAPRNLNTHHLFSPPATKSVWEVRKKELREQLLVAAGLWPLPEKTPLNPQFTGKTEGPDYIIENVAIETRPGFYLSGNLYRPKGKKGLFPGIANPHGHWSNGRLEMQPDVPKADPHGKMGEGKGNLVSIGVNLARQGFVVFAYDMAGYNDTSQVNHQFAGNLDAWLWGVSLFGLQTWNSIRAVDFLESLPYVDRKRIGATGASGGGTQTFILSAIDDRIKAAVPVNMISSSMQGGCLCENGPGLRVGTDNVEIGALFAPKPLLLVAATGDWTKNNPTEEWPAIKRIYELYGAGDKTAVKQFNYQHNYNVESREAMYAWFGKWLLNDPNPEHFREKPFEADAKVMHVWNASHPMPSNALKEADLIRSMREDATRRVEALWPSDRAGLRSFRDKMRPALLHSLAISPEDRPALTVRTSGALQSLTRKRTGSGPVALLVTRQSGDPDAKRLGDLLLAKGYDVSVLTLKPSVQPDLWKEFYSGYNQTPFGEDVETVLGGLHTVAAPNAKVDVVAFGDAGPAALVARGLYAGSGRTVIDASALPVEDTDYLSIAYAPGFRGAGDFRTAAVLAASGPLTLYNVPSGFETGGIQRGYSAVQTSLRVEKGSATPEQIAGWLAGR